jgi:hypothetical protein
MPIGSTGSSHFSATALNDLRCVSFLALTHGSRVENILVSLARLWYWRTPAGHSKNHLNRRSLFLISPPCQPNVDATRALDHASLQTFLQRLYSLSVLLRLLRILPQLNFVAKDWEIVFLRTTWSCRRATDVYPVLKSL